jgi:RNA polymerase sigma factor (sigma-70 family)
LLPRGRACWNHEFVPLVSPEPAAELVALDDALSALESVDARKSQVVELRYFGGLSVEEAAEVLKVSTVTVMRDWSMAKAWLYRALNREAGDEA